ncbi:MAG: hypothetical protein DMF85_00025 [Acidobacteria bacterium]|nr:MAG: hypothetical protein DMF85_00025 [Acidobacteriota bacterium]
MPYVYRPEILDALAGHGVRPTPDSAPARVREAVSDLYRYEIRRLRSALLAGRVAKPDYIGRVVALRQRYWVLSVPVDLWLT